MVHKKKSIFDDKEQNNIVLTTITRNQLRRILGGEEVGKNTIAIRDFNDDD